MDDTWETVGICLQVYRDQNALFYKMSNQELFSSNQTIISHWLVPLHPAVYHPLGGP